MGGDPLKGKGKGESWRLQSAGQKEKKCPKVGLSRLSRVRGLGWVQWLGEEGGREAAALTSSGGAEENFGSGDS